MRKHSLSRPRAQTALALAHAEMAPPTIKQRRETTKHQREEEGKRFIITVFGEIDKGVRGVLGGGPIGFVPEESGIEEGNCSLTSERRALVVICCC